MSGWVVMVTIVTAVITIAVNVRGATMLRQLRAAYVGEHLARQNAEAKLAAAERRIAELTHERRDCEQRREAARNALRQAAVASFRRSLITYN